MIADEQSISCLFVEIWWLPAAWFFSNDECGSYEKEGSNGWLACDQSFLFCLSENSQAGLARQLVTSIWSVNPKYYWFEQWWVCVWLKLKTAGGYEPVIDTFLFPVSEEILKVNQTQVESGWLACVVVVVYWLKCKVHTVTTVSLLSQLEQSVL